MFLNNLAASIEAAFGADELDCLARAIWQGHGAGNISDTEAQELAERIASRRSSRRMPMKGSRAPQGGRSMILATHTAKFKNSRYRASDSIVRRKRLALSGPLPPALAAHFTIAELAALRIIGDEVRARGRCDACNEEIAARAGVSRSSAKNAVREAVRLGLLVREERRYRGRRSDPNILEIISTEWLVWLRQGRGVKSVTTTDSKIKKAVGNLEQSLTGIAEAKVSCRYERSSDTRKKPKLATGGSAPSLSRKRLFEG